MNDIRKFLTIIDLEKFYGNSRQWIHIRQEMNKLKKYYLDGSIPMFNLEELETLISLNIFHGRGGNRDSVDHSRKTVTFTLYDRQLCFISQNQLLLEWHLQELRKHELEEEETREKKSKEEFASRIAKQVERMKSTDESFDIESLEPRNELKFNV